MTIGPWGSSKKLAWEVQPKKRGGCCSIGQNTPLSTVDDTVVKKRFNFQEYHVWHLLASLCCKKSLDMLVWYRNQPQNQLVGFGTGSHMHGPLVLKFGVIPVLDIFKKRRTCTPLFSLQDTASFRKLQACCTIVDGAWECTVHNGRSWANFKVPGTATACFFKVSSGKHHKLALLGSVTWQVSSHCWQDVVYTKWDTMKRNVRLERQNGWSSCRETQSWSSSRKSQRLMRFPIDWDSTQYSRMDKDSTHPYHLVCVCVHIYI